MRNILSRATTTVAVGSWYRSLFYYFLYCCSLAAKIGASSQATGISMVSECFSCMSKVYVNSWSDLTLLYYLPSNFTDMCSHPNIARPPIGTKPCPGPCVTLAERKIVGGVVVGYNYIRGCSTRLVIWDFDPATTKKITNYAAQNRCIPIPAKLLLAIEARDNSASAKSPRLFDHFVLVCPCRGNRCNGNNVPYSLTNSASRMPRPETNALCASSLFYCILGLTSAPLFNLFLSYRYQCWYFC